MSYRVKVLIAEDNFLVGKMIQGVACLVAGRAIDGRPCGMSLWFF